ncbi:MAG: GNAT family N-acetyltransferase [Bacteroides sp.]|nr:GNAT family N-acetyltransferase [Bacteroides sp.]MBD5359031.1 GNAT family N-acetyltransferase [Bacteroides sp.]
MTTKIIPASPEHAPYIGKAIIMAIGEELTNHLAGEKHTPEDVENLFTSLAQRTDSQYTYLNSMVAVDEDNNVEGVVVSYDGARLYELRKAFFEEAEKAIDLKIEGTPDAETGPEEFYLDTLAVFPEYRGKGIATNLIKAAGERAASAGKPLGLLVSKTNPNARHLYDTLGFRPVGERPFAGEVMNHLQLKPDVTELR